MTLALQRAADLSGAGCIQVITERFGYNGSEALKEAQSKFTTATTEVFCQSSLILTLYKVNFTIFTTERLIFIKNKI